MAVIVPVLMQRPLLLLRHIRLLALLGGHRGGVHGGLLARSAKHKSHCIQDVTCPHLRSHPYVTIASPVFTISAQNKTSRYTLLYTSAMSAYLDEQTPHLRHLHAQLSLPPTALEQDLHRIEAAIKAVITSIIREREAQVDQLKDDIAATKSDLATLQRAVGDRRDREREKEGEEEETLPRQLERLNDQAVELKKVYDERLVHIKQQQSTLDRLSTLLGPPWQPMKPLEVIASSSRSRASSSSGMGVNANPSLGVDGKRSVSSWTQTIAQAIALGHAHGQAHTQSQGQDKNKGQWYDVRESVVEEIDQAVKLALAERVRPSRLTTMSLLICW